MDKKKDTNWKYHMARIVEHVNKNYGYEVLYEYRKPGEGNIDAAYHDEKVIRIDKSYKDETKTYILLHEVGHVIQYNNEHVYDRQFGAIFNGLFSKSSLTRRMAVLNGEFDAWNKGLTFADQMKIPINQKKFETVKTKCLNTYVQWASNKK